MIFAHSSSALQHTKRGPGIVVAAVASVVLAIVAAVTSAVSLTGTLQNAASINELQNATTHALRIQGLLNPHFGTAIAVLQEEVELIQEELEGLWVHSWLACDPRYVNLCLTPFPVVNYSQRLLELSAYMYGP